MIRFCLKEIICQDVLWIIDLYNVQQKSLGRGSDHFIQFVLYRPLLDTYHLEGKRIFYNNPI